MPIISGTDLASYPGIDPGLTSGQLDWIAERVDALVADAWRCETDPVPAWVVTIAYNAAGRFAQNPRGLDSFTTTVDVGSHTQRHRSGGGTPGGIYLTEDELSSLACGDLASGVGTIWTTPTRPPGTRGY